MPRTTPLRGMSLSGGLQTLMHGHVILPRNMDEVQPHYTFKCECDTCSFGNQGSLVEFIHRLVSINCIPTLTLCSFPITDKKYTHSNATQSCPTDVTLRNFQRTGTNLPSTGLLPDGKRVNVPQPGARQQVGKAEILEI